MEEIVRMRERKAFENDRKELRDEEMKCIEEFRSNNDSES